MALILTILPVLAWGLQDVFIKMSANTKDDFYLKIPVCYSALGIVFLVVGRFLSESGLGIFSLMAENKLITFSHCVYILATFICFFGASFLEMSIYSPLENVDGAMTILMFIAYFIITGKTYKLSEFLTFTNIVGVLLSLGGVFWLAVLQNKQAKTETEGAAVQGVKKKKSGAWALLFPLGFCVMDGLATFVDGMVLGVTGEQTVGSVDYLRIIGFWAVVYGLIAVIILLVKNKKIYTPFTKTASPFWGITICELIATISYPFAMEGGAILPVIAFNSYSIVTIIILRIFLKEKLTKWQYVSVGVVLCGVIMVALSEIIG